MHGGGAKKGGSGTDKIVNKEPSRRGGAIGGKRGGKASGAQGLVNPNTVSIYVTVFCTLIRALPACVNALPRRLCLASLQCQCISLSRMLCAQCILSTH